VTQPFDRRRSTCRGVRLDTALWERTWLAIVALAVVLPLLATACGGGDRSVPASEVASRIQNYLASKYGEDGVQVECAEGENERSRSKGGEGYVCVVTDLDCKPSHVPGDPEWPCASGRGEWSGEAEVSCRRYEPGPMGNDATCGFFVASAFDGHGATGGFSFDAP
jgi:hypothetical protein